jgi:hypothetical protein
MLKHLCLLFTLFFFTLSAVSAADSPIAAARCPVLIGQAMDAADVETFEKLVDVNAILNAGLDIFLRDLEAMQATGDVPPMLALLFSPLAVRNAAAEQARGLLIAETRAFVLNGVASGAFAGRPPSGPSAQGLLAPLFAEASTGRKEIRDIGAPARAQGEDWLVPFMVHDFGSGEEYPVIGRLSPVGDGFRLVAVENLTELIRRVNEERKKAGS